jgi:hypothetical protein
MQINLICQGCGAEIPTGAWYNTCEGVTLLVPSVCKCMRTVEVPETEIQATAEFDDIDKGIIKQLVNDYGAYAVIRAADGMVKK